jgi:predicted alternative tryptophan synthase beta-subunit
MDHLLAELGREILEYVRDHPGCTREEILDAVTARPLTEEEEEYYSGKVFDYREKNG